MKFNYCIVLAFILLISSCKEKKEPIIVQEVEKIESKWNKNVNAYVDLEGNPVELSDFKGKKILLNFWATWCRPCIEEMPSLLKAQEILKKENYVFLLATDQSIKTIMSFKTRKEFEFTFIKYTGAFADLGIKALPKTFIYNESGEKVEEISGAMEWDSPEIIERLKAIN